MERIRWFIRYLTPFSDATPKIINAFIVNKTLLDGNAHPLSFFYIPACLQIQKKAQTLPTHRTDILRRLQLTGQRLRTVSVAA
jgi:hypothetical protein